FFVSRGRRHTMFSRDWSSDVCSSDLESPGSRRGFFCSYAGLAASTATPGLREPGTEVSLMHEVCASADLHRKSRRRPPLLGGGRSEERRVGKERRWQKASCLLAKEEI